MTKHARQANGAVTEHARADQFLTGQLYGGRTQTRDASSGATNDRAST